VATIVSNMAARFASYFGHPRVSFAVASNHQVFVRCFLVIAMVTLEMKVGVTFLLTSILGISYRISIAVVTVLIPITNYPCNRFWVFHPGLEPLSKAGQT
jgi:putative flippase GtrA